MDQFAGLQAVDHLDRAVMLDLQPLGQGSDGCSLAVGQAFHRQERLVLLRFHTGGPCRLFAEIQESPDLVAKLPESLNVIRGAPALFHGH